MSDEDAELKDVLVRSLNENGILPRLQAQLRAAVFVALEKHNFNEYLKPPNDVFRSFMRTDDGLLVASLIVDFLSQMNLDNTLEVLKNETELDQNLLLDREKISFELRGAPLEKGKPLIAQLVSDFRVSGILTRSQRPGRSRSERQSTSNDSTQPTLNGPTDKRSPNPPSEQEALIGHRKYPPAGAVSNGSAHPESPSPPSDTSGDGGELNGASEITTVDKRSHSDRERCVATGLQHQQTINSSQQKLSISSGDRMDQQTYEDDFTSPRSPKTSVAHDSDTTPATSCHLLSDTTHSKPHRHQESILTLPPRAGSASPRKSPSVIRVYVRNRRRDSASSDVDASSDIDDDDGEIVEECLSLTLAHSWAAKDKTVELSNQQHSQLEVRVDDEITIDETIDSEGSLVMDHVEDVLPSTATTGPAHETNSDKIADPTATLSSL